MNKLVTIIDLIEGKEINSGNLIGFVSRENVTYGIVQINDRLEEFELNAIRILQNV